jgi:hypothetical protein
MAMSIHPLAIALLGVEAAEVLVHRNSCEFARPLIGHADRSAYSATTWCGWHICTQTRDHRSAGLNLQSHSSQMATGSWYQQGEAVRWTEERVLAHDAFAERNHAHGSISLHTV